jgi:hypothetical protein
MVTRLIPFALLTLTGCAHNLATCDNARKVATAATVVMARICPMAVR